MAQYNTGTVSVTALDATVTGSGTSWTTEIAAGQLFTVVGDNEVYEVASVTSDTELELTQPYAGTTASGQSYIVARDFTPLNDIPLLSPGDLETAKIYNRAMNIIDGLL
jgi:hypothetical protein